MFPIQDGTAVRWELAERAYATYARLFGTSQSLQRLAERGGFGAQEFACLFAGHDPRHKDTQPCLEKADAVGRKITELERQLAEALAEREEIRQAVDKLMNSDFVCSRCGSQKK